MPQVIKAVPPLHYAVITNAREAAAPNFYNVLQRYSSGGGWRTVASQIPGGSGARTLLELSAEDSEVGIDGYYWIFGWKPFTKIRTHDQTLQLVAGFDDFGDDNDYNDLVVRIDLIKQDLPYAIEPIGTAQDLSSLLKAPSRESTRK